MIDKDFTLTKKMLENREKADRQAKKKARWQAKDNKLEYTKEYSDSNYTAQKREN